MGSSVGENMSAMASLEKQAINKRATVGERWNRKIKEDEEIGYSEFPKNLLKGQACNAGIRPAAADEWAGPLP